MKRKYFLKEASVLFVVAIMCITAFAVFPTVNADCPDDMISYWKGDGDADDYYGSNDGTYHGSGYVSGQVDQAFSFDGIDDYVEIPDDSSLNLGTGDFTLEAWINADQNQESFPSILSNRGDDEFNGFLFGLSLWDQAVEGSLFIQIEGTNYIPCSTDLRGTGWHHVAVTRTGSSITFYIDGSQDGTASSSKDLDSAGDMWIGWDEAKPSTTPFNGLIDEVAVYDRALHVSEISNHYNAGLDNRGYCNITFMGLGVKALGNAKLDITDVMRIYDISNTSNDGVMTELEGYNAYGCKLYNLFQSDEASVKAEFSGTYNGVPFDMALKIGPYFPCKGKGVYPVGFDGTASGAPSIIAWDFGDGDNETNVTWIWNWEENGIHNLKINKLMVTYDTGPGEGSLEYASIYAAGKDELEMREHHAYEIEPPVAPGIDGPTSGEPGTPYTYTITNPGVNDAYFFINWDDGTPVDYTELTTPAGTTTASHTWTAEGAYTIKVRAMNRWGAISEWTEFTVTMPRNKITNNFNTPFLNYLQNFLNGHPNLFPILQQLLLRLGLQ